MSETKWKDEFRVKKTSYRTFEVLDPKGYMYFIWADPQTGVLHCTCPFSVRAGRPRVCKHIKLVKELFDYE